MVDNSKEGLMLFNKKASFSSSFYPISEKQEEMSFSSKIPNNLPIPVKSKISNKINEGSINTKNIVDDGDFIKHSRTQKNKKSWIFNNKDSFFKLKVGKKEEEEEVNKFSLQKSPKYKKRLTKINSCQEKGNILLFNMTLNNSELRDKHKKGSVGRHGQNLLGSFSNSYLHQKSFNNQDNSLGKRNSKSITNIVDFTKINRKHTILHKGKLDINEKGNISIYDQIKNSESYEKSESLIFKLKICFAILAVFSLISIILNCADALIYNNRSLEYIINENNSTIFDKNNISNYYCINKRKISSKENNIRIFNGIFSLFCFIIIIIIYKIKIGAFEINKKDTKKEKFRRMLNEYYNKKKKKPITNQKTFQDKDRYERIKIYDFKEEYKDPKDDQKNIIERNITIRMCIVNIIFYPPYINAAFIGQYHNIIFIYSLNSLFLIISLFKISNLYKAFFCLSKLNNTFNKAICKSNLLNLDSSFSFKYSINKYPISFLILNIIMIFIIISIILFCVEFFSLDISDDFWNNSNENQKENFLNILNTFLFFITRNIHEEHCIKSLFGKLILYFGGLTGMLFTSYFLFYMNGLIELNPEEEIAFSKLKKLFNPINKEHKASNLIKSIFLIKKIYFDNKNTIRDYKLKNTDIEKPKNLQRRDHFLENNAFNLVFNSNGTLNNININEINSNEEKKKFIKYIGSVFLFKTKVKVELKNFADNLKVARNYSLSFNDILKTICNKLDVNTGQLNNKLEILIKKDKKYLDFIRFTSSTIKKIQKLADYHRSIIQYLSEIHNEHVKQVIEIKKEAEIVSPILYKNSVNFPKRMKSNIFGGLTFQQRVKNKLANNVNKKAKKKKPKFDFGYTTFTLKKQKSSHITSTFLQNNILGEKMKQVQAKLSKDKVIPPKARNSTVNKRAKSIDEWDYIQNELKDIKDTIKVRQSFMPKVERSASALNEDNKDQKNIKDNKSKKDD
jgi:hypothetical protein